jgi:beta-glucosidase
MCTGLLATEFPPSTLSTMSLPEILTGLLPPTFAHGYASSATQLEGGWTEDGKGSSVWGRYSRDGQLFDGSSCAVANDSYHLANKDVELLKVSGAKAYRFSIAWTTER